MNKLLKLQLRNVFHNKLFYICFGLSVLLQLTLSIIEITVMPTGLKAMPQVIDLITGGLDIICIIFIAIFSCSDYSDGTAKNIISRGYTKNELLISKYIISTIAIFIIILSTLLVVFFAGLRNGLGYESNMLLIIINSTIKYISYIVLYSTMAFLLEKTSSSIIACLFAPNVISPILHLLDTKLNIEFSKYWLFNLSNEFLLNTTTSKCMLSILGYVIYIALIIIIGTYLNNKKEIK